MTLFVGTGSVVLYYRSVSGACTAEAMVLDRNMHVTRATAHYDRLYRLARRLTASQDDALDLVQETFVRAARFSDKVPGTEPDAEAWLVRVLVNVRRDQWRRRAVRERYDVSAVTPAPVGAAESRAVAHLTVWNALTTAVLYTMSSQ